jgi:hypothetical protein
MSKKKKNYNRYPKKNIKIEAMKSFPGQYNKKKEKQGALGLTNGEER